MFSIVFFLLVFLLCVRETAVVDIVGKVLTPALLAGLLVLIVVGVVHPMGPVGEALWWRMWRPQALRQGIRPWTCWPPCSSVTSF